MCLSQTNLLDYVGTYAGESDENFDHFTTKLDRFCDNLKLDNEFKTAWLPLL